MQNKQRVVNARVSDIYGRLEGRRREGGEEIVWKLKLNVFPVPSHFLWVKLFLIRYLLALKVLLDKASII